MSTLHQIISKIASNKIDENREAILNEVVKYIQQKKDLGDQIKLNFICTHNSRRSQLSQVWAQVMANYFKVNCLSYSGGVEVTAFNHRAVNTLKSQGFIINVTGSDSKDNPIYHISTSDKLLSIDTFSKLYNHKSSPTKDFAAIMTCSDADDNCPFIPGTEKRIPLRYNDPKTFDDTPLEEEKYLERSIEIATEMHYIFSQIK